MIFCICRGVIACFVKSVFARFFSAPVMTGARLRAQEESILCLVACFCLAFNEWPGSFNSPVFGYLEGS